MRYIKYMEKKSLEGKRIAIVLKNMKLNDIEDWSIKRYSSVVNTIQRLKREKYPSRVYEVKSSHTIMQVKRIK